MSIFDTARKSIFWMIAAFLIAIVTITFTSVLIRYDNNATFLPTEMKAESIAVRFTNIPECFAYQDPTTKRVYPNVIDSSKFTVEHLEQSCYHTSGHNEINFKILLGNQEIKTNNFYETAPIVQLPVKTVTVRQDNGAISQTTFKVIAMKEI